jgi:RimJ/RimL family protein N-acetyltransferase
MPAELAGERLRLGAWRDEDLDAYEALVHERDPRTAAAPRNGRPTRDDLREKIARHQASIATHGIGLYVVRIADRFAGYCGLVRGRATWDEPELAYELARAHQGLGYATEAARATVRAAAGTGRTRLWASVRPWNLASFNVLAKLGFERTAEMTTDDFGDLVWCTYRLTTDGTDGSSA